MRLLCLAALLGAVSADWTTQQWDIVVVGAGPAGIIVASRMAEAGLQTLLLEGGGLSYGVTGGDLDARRPTWLDGTDLTRVDVPGLYKSIFTNSQGDLTCPSDQVSAYGGCNIGGSSSINAGLFFEPPASDWDLYHPDGWKSTDMDAAIKRLYAKQSATSTPSQDGKRYLQTGYDSAREWLVDGLGYQEVDINAKADTKTKVFGHPIYDYIGGQRGGPVVTYLQSALKLANFQLQSSVRVVRVERSGEQASGVVVLVNGVETTIALSSKGRVILSAGAIQSPSLLMHSGIGAADVLTTLSSAGKLAPKLAVNDWINSTSVGSGLFDNPNTFIVLKSSSISSYDYFSYQPGTSADSDQYLASRSGTYSFASQTSVFWDTITREDNSVVGLQGTIDSAGYGEYTEAGSITLNIYGTSGLQSTGSVVLDPTTHIPGIDGNVYYSAPNDAKYIAQYIHSIFAGLPSSLEPLNIARTATQDEIETYITTYSKYARGETNHWSSSCRIGSCVDKNTAVVGMNNLHVVDSSIVAPLTVNPQFGIMAAAERAAELILALDGLSISTT